MSSSSVDTQDKERLLKLGHMFRELIRDMRAMEDQYAASRRAATATRDEAREMLSIILIETQAAVHAASRVLYNDDAVAGTFALMGPSSSRLLYDALAAAGLDPDKRQGPRRHWLTALPVDENERVLKVWREAPSRMEVRSFAAAYLVAFGQEVTPPNEEQAAREVQGALHRSNFDNERLSDERVPKVVGLSTIKSWVETFKSGLTAEGRSASKTAQQLFADRLAFLRHVRDQGVSREDVLRLLEDFCLMVSPPLAEKA